MHTRSFKKDGHNFKRFFSVIILNNIQRKTIAQIFLETKKITALVNLILLTYSIHVVASHEHYVVSSHIKKRKVIKKYNTTVQSCCCADARRY